MLAGLLDRLAEALARLDPLPVAALLAAAALLLALWVAARRLPGPWRMGVTLVLSIVSLRYLLFANPVAWLAYDRLLNEDDVGRRQDAALLLETRRYLRHPHPVEYLAVGSSQTWAIYNQIASDDARFDLFTMPGMEPFDFVLYREYIARYRPRSILLYVSESDVGRDLSYSALRFAPAQGLYWSRLLPPLWRTRSLSSEQGRVTEMLAGEILPEYKYGFVLQGLVSRLIGARRYGGLELAPERPDEERLQLNLEGLATGLAERNLDLQFFFLQEFAEYCGRAGVRLVIVEGQYHPLGYTEENLRLNALVRARLSELAAARTHVSFLPRAELYEFTAEDYKDGLHVTREAARRFTEALLARLEAADPRRPQPPRLLDDDRLPQAPEARAVHREGDRLLDGLEAHHVLEQPRDAQAEP